MTSLQPSQYQKADKGKMNKCQHNEKIQLFCIYERCSWKDAGGCPKCMKAHHNHSENNKVLNEEQIQSIIKKFTFDHSNKPNCRSIQEGIYKHFSNIRMELNSIISDIQLACKTIVNQIGYPYLHQHNLVGVFKKIKHKQYKKVNKKEFQNFYQASKKITPRQFQIEESKIYKDNLKRNRKILTEFQNLIISYEKVFKYISSNYQRQKSTFSGLSHQMKETINQTTSLIQRKISQMGIKHPESSKASDRESARMTNAIQRSSNIPAQKYKQTFGLKDGVFSPPYEETKKGYTFKEAELSSDSQQGYQSTPHSTRHKNQQRKAMHSKGSQKEQNFKLAFKDIDEAQRNPKQASKKYNSKNRQISLDRKMENSKKRTESLLQEFRNETNNQKQMWDEMKSGRDRTNSLNKNDEKESPSKECEISARKQQLKSMMRQSSKTYKQEIGSKFTLKNNENIRQIFETETSVSPESSPMRKSKENRNTNVFRVFDTQESPNIKNPKGLDSSQSPTMRNSGESFHSYQSKRIRKQSQASDSRPSMMRNSLQKHQIPSNINSKQQNTKSSDKNSKLESCESSSLEYIKRTCPKQSPQRQKILQGSQQTDKPYGCSRLIIIADIPKILLTEEQCGSPFIKEKIQKVNQTGYFSLKPIHTSESKQVNKQEQREQYSLNLTENEEKSVSLLIKSVKLGSQEAIKLLIQALRIAPNNLSAAQYLSYLYLENGKARETLQVCNAILDRIQISKQNNNEEMFLSLQNNKAAALNINGRFSQAIPLLQKCIKIKQQEIFYKNIGDSYHFNGSYDKAITYYEKAIKMDVNLDEAHYNLSACYYVQKNYQNAKVSIKNALNRNPRQSDYLELKENIDKMLGKVNRRNQKEPATF